MKVLEFIKRLEERVPQALGAEWDNDGVMICTDPDGEVKKCLTCLDVTDAVIDHAVENGFEVILSHHPLLFRPINRMDLSVTSFKNEDIAVKAIKHSITVISFHTRFDAIAGGINDNLCKLLGLENVRICRDEEFSLMRYGELPESFTAEKIASICQSALELTSYGDKAILYGDCKKSVKTVALVTGSGGDYINSAIREGADIFISGDLGYHKICDAVSHGMAVLDAGHAGTERPCAYLFASLIRELFGNDIETKVFLEKRKIKYV